MSQVMKRWIVKGRPLYIVNFLFLLCMRIQMLRLGWTEILPMLRLSHEEIDIYQIASICFRCLMAGHGEQCTLEHGYTRT